MAILTKTVSSKIYDRSLNTPLRETVNLTSIDQTTFSYYSKPFRVLDLYSEGYIFALFEEFDELFFWNMNLISRVEDFILVELAPNIGQEKEYEKRQRNPSLEWSL